MKVPVVADQSVTGTLDRNKFLVESGYPAIISMLVGREYLRRYDISDCQDRYFIHSAYFAILRDFLEVQYKSARLKLESDLEDEYDENGEDEYDTEGEGEDNEVELVGATDALFKKKLGARSYDDNDYLKDYVSFLSSRVDTEKLVEHFAEFRKLLAKLASITTYEVICQFFLTASNMPSLAYADDETLREAMNSNISSSSLLNVAVRVGECLVPVTYKDLFEEFSNRYLYIPPLSYRQDATGDIPSPLRKVLDGVVKTIKAYEREDRKETHAVYLKKIYQDLLALKQFSIDAMKDHKSKNAVLRDNVLSCRISWSARGYIIGDPSLSIDEAGIPFHQASVLFEAFLVDKNRYAVDSSFRILWNEISVQGSSAIKKVITNLVHRDYRSINNMLRAKVSILEVLMSIYADKGEQLPEKYGGSRGYCVFYEECREDVKQAINDLFGKYLVNLERAPSLWRYSNQAFRAHVVEGYCIHLCQLNCKAFNADFDGDQMSVCIVISEEGRMEQEKYMLPSKNLISIKNGEVIPEINQDMALGLYWATVDVHNRVITEEEHLLMPPKAFFNDVGTMIRSFEIGTLQIHDYVSLNIVDEEGTEYEYKDTVGRIWFNSLLPGSMGFTKEILGTVGSAPLAVTLYKLRTQVMGLTYVNKDGVKKVIGYVKDNVKDKLAMFLNKLKNFGFQMATESGVTISLFDFEDIAKDEEIKAIVEEAKYDAAEAKRMHELGMKTYEEYCNYLESSVNGYKSRIEKKLREIVDPYGNIAMLIQSGARGSYSQLVELSAMVGLPKDSNGNTIPSPIFESNIGGLGSRNYFNTAHSVRSALVTTAISTGDIGAVSRDLVYTVDHDKISVESCNADSVIVDVRYEIELPASFDIGSSKLLPYSGKEDGADSWDELRKEWNGYLNNGGSKMRGKYPVSEQLMCSLLQKYKIRKMVYSTDGTEHTFDVKYKMSSKSKSLILFRTVDTTKLFNQQEFFGVSKGTLDTVTHTLKSPIDEKLIQYGTVSEKTIAQMEQEIVLRLPVFLAMYCECNRGICAKCYGASVEGKELVHNTMVGIQSAQVVGQTTTQLAMDTHKAGASKQVTSFAKVKDLLAQHNIGSTVITAPCDGELVLIPQGQAYNICIVTADKLHYVTTQTDTSVELMVKDGDFVKKGDLIYYDGTLNYLEMYSQINDLLKCRLNALYSMAELYEGMSIRHFDILMRELLKFGVAEKDTVGTEGRVYVRGGTYAISDMKKDGVEFIPAMVCTLTSMMLNNKAATAQAKECLNMQVGQAAVLKKESSVNSLISAQLRGISLSSVFKLGVQGISETAIRQKYANRAYGEGIYVPKATISARIAGSRKPVIKVVAPPSIAGLQSSTAIVGADELLGIKSDTVASTLPKVDNTPVIGMDIASVMRGEKTLTELFCSKSIEDTQDTKASGLENTGFSIGVYGAVGSAYGTERTQHNECEDSGESDFTGSTRDAYEQELREDSLAASKTSFFES